MTFVVDENQTSEEVKEANPFTRKLPCINDNGFCLSERYIQAMLVYS